MRAIGEHIKAHVSEVLVEWERLVREFPWYSLPAAHRIDGLPDVIVALVEASLCKVGDRDACRLTVEQAAEHGRHRREHGIPEHLILTEFHLLRQAIWYYLLREYQDSNRVTDAIMRVDNAMTLATNASMWGYHRLEIEALGKWDLGLDRMVADSPLLRQRA
jgi:hypothetical protein